jgi:carotenoid cleavage dioxygenase-like enzyme
MAFHATQAWCEGRDLVLDIAIYDDGTVFDDLLLARRRADEPMRAVPRHVRYRLRDGRAEAEPEPLGQVIELQQVHPAAIGRRRASVCWGAGGEAGGRLLDRTLRWDLDSGELRSWQRPDAMQLEPLFVPRPGASADDDGVLLVPTLAAADATTVLAVVDARSLQPRALLYAPQVLPFGFHAAFATG